MNENEIRFGENTQIPEIGLQISSTVYPRKGLLIRRKLSKRGMSTQSYARRHLVVSGSFQIRFPFTSYPDDLARTWEVWPGDDHKDIDRFTLVAAEDGSKYHCFMPIDANQQVIHGFIPLEQGVDFIAMTGKAYVPLVDFMSDGVQHAAGTVLVCASKDRVITPLASGKIATFQRIFDTGAANIQYG